MRVLQGPAPTPPLAAAVPVARRVNAACQHVIAHMSGHWHRQSHSQLQRAALLHDLRMNLLHSGRRLCKWRAGHMHMGALIYPQRR